MTPTLTVDDVQWAKTRDALVPRYAAVIRHGLQTRTMPDVSAVNHAIIARWSESALIYIKKRAWKLAGL